MGWEVIRGDREGNVPTKVDAVIDCAAYGNLSDQIDMRKMHEVNWIRFNRLMENAIFKGVPFLIATSSSSVSLNVQTPYSATKVLQEYELSALSRIGFDKKILNSAIVRPYTIYGVGDNEKHLIPKLFDSCLNGTFLNLSLQPTHDYIYVDDLVDIYINLLKKPRKVIVQAGTGVATSNAEVALLIEWITNKKINFDLNENSYNYDNQLWCAPIGQPKCRSLKEGLIKIYADYKQRTEKTYS